MISPGGRMKILRVFPSRTSCTPDDDMVAIGFPDMFDAFKESRREPDEIHVSVTFTWDVGRGQELKAAWQSAYPELEVKIGGPAIDGPASGPDFKPGLYLKQGIIVSSRGCPNHCPPCLVKDVPLRELEPIPEGYIIQDDNLLACSDPHITKVIDMLNETQKRGPLFKGGLEARRLTRFHVQEFMRFKRPIQEFWMACDRDQDISPLAKATELMEPLGLSRRKKRCYVLLEPSRYDIAAALKRIKEVWELGWLPFAQLYRPPEQEKPRYSDDWRALMREWSRPAASVVEARRLGWSKP